MRKCSIVPHSALSVYRASSMRQCSIVPLLCLQGIFRETMLYQFLTVLLQVLVCRSHDLLQEEIAVTVYNMASVDFDTFYACFLPTFLAGCEGIDASQKAVLAQNFKMDCVSDSVDRLLKGYFSQ